MTAVTQAKSSKADDGFDGLVRLSRVPGAVMDIGMCRFLPDAAPASLHLAMLCGEATGRLSPSGAGGYREHGEPRLWPKLADVDRSAIQALVRRIEKAHAGFKLDAPDGLSVQDALDVHFARAQRRWKRERGA